MLREETSGESGRARASRRSHRVYIRAAQDNRDGKAAKGSSLLEGA